VGLDRERIQERSALDGTLGERGQDRKPLKQAPGTLVDARVRLRRDRQF
jgi:hypothetical protein